jgi:hypothetical protein
MWSERGRRIHDDFLFFSFILLEIKISPLQDPQDFLAIFYFPPSI